MAQPIDLPDLPVRDGAPATSSVIAARSITTYGPNIAGGVGVIRRVPAGAAARAALDHKPPTDTTRS